MEAKAGMNVSSKGRRLAGVLACALVLAVLTGGCGLLGRNAGVSATDDAGREITLERAPKKIVSMAPSNTEILFALGLGERVVGVTNYCNYPPETAGIPRVGDAWSADYEKIVSLEPDLVLAVGTATSQLVTGLEGYGLKVFILQAETVDHVARDIELVGRITGASAAAERLAGEVRGRVESVAQTVATVPEGERTRVFWALDGLLWTVGPGSFVHDLIVLAGGRNVADGVGTPYGQLSMESLLQADPDVIIIPLLDPTVSEALAALGGWGTLRAVREGRVYQIDPDIVSQPGPRVAEGLEQVARLLYPDLFDN
jgi:iron complex transport system substrate-binding protein